MGAQILNPREGTFSFQRGPIFTHVLLADEINRASPRTQSALLEAMNEGQATIDGKTHALPAPFFVIATQNPSDSTGTYPLPEAQLDCFLLRLSVGYPNEEAELRMLSARRENNPLDDVAAVADEAALVAMQRDVRAVKVDDRVARHLLRVVAKTREHGELALGVSPRGALALYRAAQARAFVAGRAFVSPDDVQALVGPVLAHRVQLTTQARYAGTGAEPILASIVQSVAIPA